MADFLHYTGKPIAMCDLHCTCMVRYSCDDGVWLFGEINEVLLSIDEQPLEEMT